MTVHQVRLRKMTPAEYTAATEHREAESLRELSKFLPEDLARERVQAGTARFLPAGPDTPGHYLLTAENESGDAVGTTWLGPDPTQASGTATSAWLYDIHVFAPFRRLGYGSAILAAAEALIAADGMTALGLNVVGDNAAAIALYRRSGYDVASMTMRKTL